MHFPQRFNQDKAAHTIDPKWLRRLFGIFLGVTSVKMLVDTFAWMA